MYSINQKQNQNQTPDKNENESQHSIPNPIITCFIMGGLGNQLFQIATTIAYAIRYKCVFLFPYTIEVFKNRFSYWDSFLLSLKKFTTEHPECKRTITDLHYLSKFPERAFHFTPIPNIGKSVCLQGYFQSYLYFEQEKESIFKMFRLREQQEKIFSEYSEYFVDANTNTRDTITISIHFRLGDYLFLPDHHPILPLSYYEYALEYILSRLSKDDNQKRIRILYFCEKNDYSIVAKNIELLELKFSFYSIEFIKVEDDIEDWKQMLIMSLCQHHIIANSTFSWWGAYFHGTCGAYFHGTCGAYFHGTYTCGLYKEEKENETMITYPSIWFGPKLQDKIVADLFPKQWTKIN